jgi:hypothetical protein
MRGPPDRDSLGRGNGFRKARRRVARGGMASRHRAPISCRSRAKATHGGSRQNPGRDARTSEEQRDRDSGRAAVAGSGEGPGDHLWPQAGPRAHRAGERGGLGPDQEGDPPGRAECRRGGERDGAHPRRAVGPPGQGDHPPRLRARQCRGVDRDRGPARPEGDGPRRRRRGCPGATDPQRHGDLPRRLDPRHDPHRRGRALRSTPTPISSWSISSPGRPRPRRPPPPRRKRPPSPRSSSPSARRKRSDAGPERDPGRRPRRDVCSC